VVTLEEQEQLAVDVELELVVGAVSDAHRPRRHVAVKMVERALGEVLATVDAVHDLQLARPVALAIAFVQPFRESDRLAAIAEIDERRGGERGVAYPGVAVVPVALAANALRQAECRGGGDRTM